LVINHALVSQIDLHFNREIQPPANVGTVILKPTADHRLAYAQNVDSHTGEYGDGVLAPGPALVTLTSNSEFTGVPFLRFYFGDSSSNLGLLYVAEGLLGATNKIRRIKDIEPGETPAVDTTGSFTVSHTGHSSVQVTDMLFRTIGTNKYGYIVGKDATDGWIQSFSAADASPSGSTISTLTSFNTGRVPKLGLGSDNNIYIGHGNHLDKVNTSDTYSTDAFTIPASLGITALRDWNTFLGIAYHTDFTYSFDQRKAGGSSGLILWNYSSTSTFERMVPCPARYISALIPAPDGNLLVFGGLDEGKTTIYSFTGYGFNPLFSYVGDMPRSAHSIDFDALNRLNWLTADGQWLRLDLRTLAFDHLGTITTGSSAGGIFTRAVGGSGNEFILASGSGSTYTSKRATLGTYTGDAAAADDTTGTPLAVSEMISLPPNSMLNWIQIGLQKNLASGEKVEVRLYKDGSTSYSVLGSLSFSGDGARAAKKIYLRKYGIDNFAIGLAWKQSDALATSPGVISGVLDYEPLR
jgi:hypothetical protein